MARTVNRNASSGRFVKASTARRNPRTTTTEVVGTGGKRPVHRSSSTGRFVTGSTAKRIPSTTIRQEV
jgi:hypothetical protein